MWVAVCSQGKNYMARACARARADGAFFILRDAHVSVFVSAFLSVRQAKADMNAALGLF
jgi:hypothetical protein